MSGRLRARRQRLQRAGGAAGWWLVRRKPRQRLLVIRGVTITYSAYLIYNLVEKGNPFYWSSWGMLFAALGGVSLACLCAQEVDRRITTTVARYRRGILWR